MKQKQDSTTEQGNRANTLLYAVAPQPKLSTDAIALEGAVVSRGNGIGATSEFIALFDIQKQPLPIVGMKINSMSEIPLLLIFQYRFCGTWERMHIGYKLTSAQWQCTKTGVTITNKQMLQMLL